jgi:hypothetical protein
MVGGKRTNESGTRRIVAAAYLTIDDERSHLPLA